MITETRMRSERIKIISAPTRGMVQSIEALDTRCATDTENSKIDIAIIEHATMAPLLLITEKCPFKLKPP